jgi:predicted Zn-dependent protease
VLDAEKYAKTQELAETARDFCDKVARLSDTVATVVDAVDRQVRLASSAGVAETNETPLRFFFFAVFSRRRDGGPFRRVVSPVSARRRRVFRRRVARRVSTPPISLADARSVPARLFLPNPR